MFDYKFTGHKEISDKSEPTGFEQYLLVETDYGERCEAYGLSDDTPLDIDGLLPRVFTDCDISLDRAMCGPNSASIITDGRSPDSVVVWESRDFYFDTSA